MKTILSMRIYKKLINDYWMASKGGDEKMIHEKYKTFMDKMRFVYGMMIEEESDITDDFRKKTNCGGE